MGLFNNFPWTNLHELNLQWIVETLKKCYSPDNPPEAMVISVNGESGVVTLYKDAVIRFPDVQDVQWNMWRNTDGIATGIEFEKGQPAKRIDGQNRIVIYDANNPPPYPVVSVNGETGEIELYTEAYVEFPDITGNNWGIQRKLNTGEANETEVGIMFDDTGKAMIIKDEDSNDLYSENNPPPYPVNSVDGNTGNVITWANHNTESLKMPSSSNSDNWAISRDITHGNLSIKLMYDDNIQNVEAYMIFNDNINAPVSIKLLTASDIPTSAGVVSFNGQTGVLTIDATNLQMGNGDIRTIAVAIGDNNTAIININNTINSIQGSISNIQNTVNGINNTIVQIDKSITYTETGDNASQNIPSGKYVIWKNNPYVSIAPISTDDVLDSSNLIPLDHGIVDNLLNTVNTLQTTVTNQDGIINTLNSKVNNMDYYTLLNGENITPNLTTVTLYGGRNLNSYKYLLAVVKRGTYYRTTMYIPTALFQMNDAMSLAEVDSSNTQRWYEVKYVNATRVNIQASSNVSDASIWLYGINQVI